MLGAGPRVVGESVASSTKSSKIARACCGAIGTWLHCRAGVGNVRCITTIFEVLSVIVHPPKKQTHTAFSTILHTASHEAELRALAEAICSAVVVCQDDLILEKFSSVAWLARVALLALEQDYMQGNSLDAALILPIAR